MTADESTQEKKKKIFIQRGFFFKTISGPMDHTQKKTEVSKPKRTI